jgi:hypothetical protein
LDTSELKPDAVSRDRRREAVVVAMSLSPRAA